MCVLFNLNNWGGGYLKNIYNCKACAMWHYLIFGYLLLTKGGVIKKHQQFNVSTDYYSPCCLPRMT